MAGDHPIDATPIDPSAPRGGSLFGGLSRLLGRLVVLALLALAGAAVWFGMRLKASLPQLEGRRPVAGLAARVVVERDALGVPTIRGEARLDVVRALGFVHAQDRFFQMDLSRRRAAGELAELLGDGPLPVDRASRVHRFRARARRALAEVAGEDLATLEAYAGGVNAGLAALSAPPFEYLVLAAEPAPWRPEDSLLVVYTMYFELNDETGARESTRGVVHDVLGPEMLAFLAPAGTEWDAPIVGEPFATPPIPGPEALDLRRQQKVGQQKVSEHRPLRRGEGARETLAGSNNWALAGARSVHGGALLANDMHLGIGVPNTWYRASLVYPDPGAPGAERQVTGVTLPGAPGIVVGSNGETAWGFTNSWGDWDDLVVLEPGPEGTETYLTAEGPRPFERHTEVLRIKGGGQEDLEVVETVWGPVIDRDHRNRQRALRWIAHDPRAVNLQIVRLETAADVEQAIAAAVRTGAPPQNFVVADRGGRIGWTILGPIPRRYGHDGRLPSSWADGSRGWDGYLDPAEYPRVLDPPSGAVWTANARVVGGEMMAQIGTGTYRLGARSRQIRDDLAALDRASERELLAIQLDDRAQFLARWQELLLEVLDADAVAEDPRRGELRRLAEEWGGRAAVSSAGYRMVRAFRLFVLEQVMDALTADCRRADERFNYNLLHQLEGALWRLVSERPRHLLDPRLSSWDEQLLAAADATVDYFVEIHPDLARHTWGARNTSSIRHPLSPFLPAVGRWLDMPPLELPGDSHMPRVQSPVEGASERLVVSPGREHQGLFHMPTGQSGHPLSPHYRDGHRAWAEGEPTPFLPGPPLRVLTLEPAG